MKKIILTLIALSFTQPFAFSQNLVEKDSVLCFDVIKRAGENFANRYLDTVSDEEFTSVYLESEQSGVYIVETINHNATRIRDVEVSLIDSETCLVETKKLR